jgi:hypothetical protein
MGLNSSEWDDWHRHSNTITIHNLRKKSGIWIAGTSDNLSVITNLSNQTDKADIEKTINQLTILQSLLEKTWQSSNMTVKHMTGK